ncbi:MAG TPA: SRPBCC family protein [Ferrovibrio sp.]|uniref:SRPBCC family protein n=1 Tax=Ferrovibrio sp. TaxID=1917215 RepID=UPI002ED11C9C
MTAQAGTVESTAAPNSATGPISTGPISTGATRTAKISERELTLTRIIDAPRETVFRAWSDPELMQQWFAPKPYKAIRVEVDQRPGGASLIVMQGPDGVEIPCPGIYPEVVPNERLVFTDAYNKAWEPAAKPFMTAIVTFEAAGAGKTRYHVRCLHWTAEDCAAHEQMGFHAGWAQCAEQLAELVARI